ncbi:hypothetical protein ACJX0J_006177, partial [Zea mays]
HFFILVTGNPSSFIFFILFLDQHSCEKVGALLSRGDILLYLQEICDFDLLGRDTVNSSRDFVVSSSTSALILITRALQALYINANEVDGVLPVKRPQDRDLEQNYPSISSLQFMLPSEISLQFICMLLDCFILQSEKILPKFNNFTSKKINKMKVSSKTHETWHGADIYFFNVFIFSVI